ncbi:DUF3592 domain-containing protein [Salidesulfovibrio onnuriiensis]|uniref:DUF3592 domain-containing protein n=1 Tax=Salidesulfovibrio onnuriiensis TaxID=2583823 RepID=UPI0011CCCDFB|nr:DUF3592 domain-containing protein [Salidesulfovibrio onnuriiensis]
MTADQFHRTSPVRPLPVRLFRYALGLAFTAGFVWLLTQIPYDIFRQERARAMGERLVHATVFEKKAVPDQDGTLLVISYRYYDLSGVEYIGVANMPEVLWKRLQKGSKVPVYYARSKPQLSRVRYMIEPEFQKRLRDWLRD